MTKPITIEELDERIKKLFEASNGNPRMFRAYSYLKEWKADKIAMLEILDKLKLGFSDFYMECPVCKKKSKFWSFDDNPNICFHCKLREQLGGGEK
jgi:hypothetical protein